MPEKTLVLGLGNILLQDEGLGVRVVEQLAARYELPPDVEVLDGGTLGSGEMAQGQNGFGGALGGDGELAGRIRLRPDIGDGEQIGEFT